MKLFRWPLLVGTVAILATAAVHLFTRKFRLNKTITKLCILTYINVIIKSQLNKTINYKTPKRAIISFFIIRLSVDITIYILSNISINFSFSSRNTRKKATKFVIFQFDDKKEKRTHTRIAVA